MRKNAMWAVGLVVVGTILGATVFRQPASALAAAANQIQNVFVTNLDANGNIKVHEQGTASVSVNSSQANPLSVSNIHDGHNLYTSGNFCDISTTDHLCHMEVGPGVPIGQELVIETASAEIEVPAGTVVEFITLDVTGAVVDLTPQKTGTDGVTDYYTATQQMRAYVVDPLLNAPLPVLCSVFTGPIAPGGIFHCSVIGYLVAQ